jgi:hypothetical protein
MEQIARPMAHAKTWDTALDGRANAAKEHISEKDRRTWPGLVQTQEVYY